MKARVMTIASITGVLLAGTAAALVNTEVLGRESTSGVATVPAATVASATPGSPVTVDTTTATTAASTSSTPPTTPVTPMTAAAASTTAVTAATTSTAVSATAAPTSPPAGQATYQVGAAGTVTVDVIADGRLVIAAVAPASGWFVERQEQEGPTSIEVRFESGEREARFEASLVRGVVVTDVEADHDDSSGHDADD